MPSDAAEVGSCAAQNAALAVLLLSSQVVGVERLARGALAAIGSWPLLPHTPHGNGHLLLGLHVSSV